MVGYWLLRAAAKVDMARAAIQESFIIAGDISGTYYDEIRRSIVFRVERFFRTLKIKMGWRKKGGIHRSKIGFGDP